MQSKKASMSFPYVSLSTLPLFLWYKEDEKREKRQARHSSFNGDTGKDELYKLSDLGLINTTNSKVRVLNYKRSMISYKSGNNNNKV